MPASTKQPKDPATAALVIEWQVRGMKGVEVARVIGADGTAVSRVKSGDRKLSAEEARKLRAYFAADGNASPAPRPEAVIGRASWPVDVPVVGTALGSDFNLPDGARMDRVEQTIMEQTTVVHFAARPPRFAQQREIYALYVVGTSMEPRFDAGQLIYVDPRRYPAIGDHVVVQLRDENCGEGNEIVCALVKKLVRRTASMLELEQYNPGQTFSVPNDLVARVHRVIPWGELLS